VKESFKTTLTSWFDIPCSLRFSADVWATTQYEVNKTTGPTRREFLRAPMAFY